MLQALEARRDRARARAARPHRPLGEARRLPRPAVGRPAAARRDRARARDAAARDAARRDHERARPRARVGGAHPRRRARARGHDDAHRHARDGLRARCREQGRVPLRRADRGGGPAGPALQQPDPRTHPQLPAQHHRSEADVAGAIAFGP